MLKRILVLAAALTVLTAAGCKHKCCRDSSASYAPPPPPLPCDNCR